MKRNIIFMLLSVLLMLSLSAFQCSSTELTSAKLYIQQKNYPKAIEALKKEVAKNPKSDEGYYWLGVVYGEQGEFKEMVDALNKSIEISDKYKTEIENAKKSYWTIAFNKGVSFFNKAAKVTSEDSVKMFREKAVESFDEAILIEPDSADNYKNLAFTYLQDNRIDDAIPTLEKLLELKKKELISSRNSLQLKGLTEENIKDCLNEPDKIIETSFLGTQAKQYEYLKYNLFIYFNNNEAIGYTKISDKDNPTESIPSCLKKDYGEYYKILGQVYSEKARDLENKYSQLKDPADSIGALEQYNKAIKVLEEGRKVSPNNQDILFYLTNAYVGANKTDIAMETFKAGTEESPNNKYYRYNYGTLLLQAGDYKKAAEQFQKAIDIDSTYQSAYYNLAVSYIRWGTALRERADSLGKDDPEYKNKYREALPLLKKSIALKPEDPLSWETISKVFAVLNMYKELEEARNKADQYRQK